MLDKEGTEWTTTQPGELILRAGYNGDAAGATIRLCPNGDIYVNGRLAATDLEVVEGLRMFAGVVRDSQEGGGDVCKGRR